MYQRITQGIQKFFREESFAERQKRILPGAIYAVLAAIIYTIVSTLVNVIFYRNLHLGVDWLNLLVRVLEYGVALGLAGAIVGWFSEDYEGIVWGGVLLAILLLIASLLAAQIGGGDSLVGKSLVTVLPVFVASILLALVLRTIIKRYLQAREPDNPAKRRKQVTQLTLLVILVSAILGVFSMFGTASINTLEALNNSLQNYASDPFAESRFPYEQVPGLKDHLGMQYVLYVQASTLVTGSMDVTIHFEDGYSISCLVPQTAGNESLFLRACSEGSKLRFP